MFGGAATAIASTINGKRTPPLAPAPSGALAPTAPLPTTLNASNAVAAAAAAALRQKTLAAAGAPLIGGSPIGAPTAKFQPKTLIGATK